MNRYARATALVLAALMLFVCVPGEALATQAGFNIDLASEDATTASSKTKSAGTSDSDGAESSDAASSEAGETDADLEDEEDAAIFTLPEGYTLDDSITIAEGVYAGSINLSGMNPTQAKEAINDFYSNVVDSRFTFTTTSGAQYDTTLSKIGFTYNTEGVVEQAAYLGRFGLLTERYKLLQDLKEDKVVINVNYSIDDEKFTDYIEENISVHDVIAQDATITRKNGEFVITPSVTGNVTDIEATKAAVIETIETGMKIGMTVEVVTKVDEPTITGESLQTIKNKLGSYTTWYGTSPDGRKNNIKVGSGNINGTVVMPGESFSTSQTMKQRTQENGYQVATEYLSGESVEAYGGGVCQVASTLYQAVLRAELQIDKRYNHSMLVSYVEPSFDAAISWGSKDFVFTNNMDTPIYISAYADGNELTFTIYGKETRASNRKITFESVIVERITSESVVVEDPNQPTTYIEKKGSNHDYCKSYLVKKIYIDGKLTDTVKFSEDTYTASHETITQGTKVDTTTPTINPTTATEATTAPTTAAP